MHNFPIDLLESIESACEGVNVRLLRFPSEEDAPVFLVPHCEDVAPLRIWMRGFDYKIEHGEPEASGRIVASPYKADVLYEVDAFISHIQALEKLESVNDTQEDHMHDFYPFTPPAEPAEGGTPHFAAKVALMAYGLAEEPSREDIIALAQTCSFLAARILELTDRIDSGEAR